MAESIQVKAVALATEEAALIGSRHSVQVGVSNREISNDKYKMSDFRVRTEGFVGGFDLHTQSHTNTSFRMPRTYVRVFQRLFFSSTEKVSL